MSLEIPTETSTWSQAVTNQSSACSVFGGDILQNISDARAFVHSTELNRPAWVGAYVRYTPWIKIIGKLSIPNFNDYNHMGTITVMKPKLNYTRQV